MIHLLSHVRLLILKIKINLRATVNNKTRWILVKMNQDFYLEKRYLELVKERVRFDLGIFIFEQRDIETELYFKLRKLNFDLYYMYLLSIQYNNINNS